MNMTGLRRLGAAVLLKAFEDAKTNTQARLWFQENPQPMLTFWCQVAGVDPDQVRKRAIQLYGKTSEI